MPELFVYGTLRRPVGGPPGDTHYHHRIASGVTAGVHGIIDNATLIDCGAYPALGRGDQRVRGEVLSLTDAALAEADLIEGHPDFYERRVETIELDNGSRCDAWVYWAPPSLLTAPGHRPIPSGDWFDRDPMTALPAPAELPDDPTALAAFARFTPELYSWLSTVRHGGRPHLVPMWHVVAANRLYFATRDDAVKVANVARTPHVMVSLPDPAEVVLVEGWAIETPHLLDVLAGDFVEKYDWDPRVPDDYPGRQTIIEVTPRVLHAWVDETTHRRWSIS